MKNKTPLIITTILSILLLLSVTSFAQVDVARKTKAVTYPQNTTVELRFRGTTRFPKMSGFARIERTKKNGTVIKLNVEKMPRTYELGPGYATYVLWAISPNGQVDNLGEIKRRGFWEFNSTIRVTTPLQTFALIVTAEPHFLVTRPSQQIMLENLNPSTRSGRTVATTSTISYFGNSSDYFRDARTPQIADVDYKRIPTSVLQARQAVALAKYAGASRDAKDELQQAEVLLKNAEGAWTSGQGEQYVDIAARKAISQAVQAEMTASIRRQAREKRNQKMRQDAELRDAEDKVSDKQNEIDNLKRELADERRYKELSERDSVNYLRQISDLKKEISSLRQENQDIKIKLATIEARKNSLEEEREKDRKRKAIEANSAVLMQSLTAFGDVRKDENRIILILPEKYWSGVRVSSFSDSYEPKLTELGQMLASNADYKIMVESHSDDRGTVEDLQVLTNERAQAVADKFMSLGVNQSRLESKGYGPTLPVASNATRSNRSKNRRVNVILTPMIQ